MAEPDRLDALRRQRALIARHLAWLDEEIRRTTGETAERVSPTLPPDLPRPRDGLPPTVVQDAVLPRPADATPPPSKVGCWLWFTLLLLAGMGSLVALIYLRYGRDG